MQNLNSLSLRQLRCFVTVAEELHFRRAADRLNMRQPPLTQRIQAMEQTLGVQLFLRKGHVVELTEVGRLVLAEARATLNQFDRIAEVAQKAGRGDIGTLRVAVVISVPFIPAFNEATKTFKRDHPGVVFDLIWTISNDGVQALRQGKVDLCFVRRASRYVDGLVQMTVARDCLKLVLPENHPRAHDEKVSLKDVADERFIVLSAETKAATYGHIANIWTRTGVKPPIAQEAQNGLAVLALVSAGFGNAILPSTLAGLHMPNVVWKDIDMDEEWTASSIVMLCRPETLNEKLPSSFIDYVRRYSSAMQREAPAQPVPVLAPH